MAYAKEGHDLVSSYALVENGVVTNVIWLAESNEGEFPGAVRLDDRPVAIGDTYESGKFRRDGKEVLTPLEQAQAEIAQYKAALETLGVELTSDGTLRRALSDSAAKHMEEST